MKLFLKKFLENNLIFFIPAPELILELFVNKIIDLSIIEVHAPEAIEEEDAVIVESVSKRFRIPHEKNTTFSILF